VKTPDQLALHEIGTICAETYEFMLVHDEAPPEYLLRAFAHSLGEIQGVLKGLEMIEEQRIEIQMNTGQVIRHTGGRTMGSF